MTLEVGRFNNWVLDVEDSVLAVNNEEFALIRWFLLQVCGVLLQYTCLLLV